MRSGKPDGEPGTHITTTISDRQSQMVEGNLSLNSPNSCTGNLFYDVYYCLKGKGNSMDGFGIWSKLSDISQYVKAKINNSSVTYSFDQRKHQIATLSNKSTDNNTSVDKMYNSKKQNFDAANCNVPNIFHHGRTSLYNVYKTLINNDHLSIVCVA